MRYYNTGLRFLTIKRGMRSLSYFFFAVAGWVSMFTVSPIIGQVTTPTVGVVWSLSLAIGGTAAFLSVLLDNWFLEYFGLPGLIAAFAVLAVAALSSIGSGGPIFVSSGFIALGIAVHLLYRLWELHNSIHHSKGA